MERIAFLEKISPWGKFLLLLGIVILTSLFTAFLGILIGKLYLGVDLQTLSEYIANPQTEEELNFLKFYQLINQMGVFIMPVFIFSFLVSPSIFRYLSLENRPQTIALAVSSLMIYTILPFNHFLGEWNQQLNLPEFMRAIEDWMNDYEEKARLLTESFLKTESVGGLVVNLFIVALVPAVGEELLFRGIVLKLMKSITGSIHLAVIISAFLFAALHLQFLSFMPRFVLGLMLGYVFVITGSIWVPMLAHFVNNASSVIIFYLYSKKQIDIPMDDFGAMPHPVYIIGSLLITIWLILIVYQKSGWYRYQ